MSINIGLRREAKGDETYSVPGFVDRVNGYVDHAPAHLVEVEPGIEYPEEYIPPADLAPQVADTIPQEVTEAIPSLKVRDNGLGIMVIDYPEAEPNISDNQDESGSIQEFTSETVLYKTPISYKKLAAGGLKRIVRAVKTIRSGAVDKYYAANASVTNGIYSAGEKLSKLEVGANRGKVIKAAGGLALLGMVAYGAHKGISYLETNHTHQAAHEAAQQLLPAKAPHHTAEALQAAPRTKTDAFAPAVHHVSKAAHAKPALDAASKTFTIEPGHGFTQELTESFGTKTSRLSPLRSYHLFSALRQHFGDHGILKHGKGLVDGTYNRNGDEFISRPGRAQWASGVTKFANQWLKTHSS